MARGINKVILIGNLGTEPEVRFLPNGTAVCNLSIATSESWKDKQTGDKQERTEWHRVSCFNKLGEIAGEYAKKGNRVYIEGSLRTRKWQDQQGQDRYTTEIIASDFQLLDSKGSGMADHASGSAPAFTSAPSAAGKASASYDQQPALSGLDEDIPF